MHRWMQCSIYLLHFSVNMDSLGTSSTVIVLPPHPKIKSAATVQENLGFTTNLKFSTWPLESGHRSRWVVVRQVESWNFPGGGKMYQIFVSKISRKQSDKTTKPLRYPWKGGVPITRPIAVPYVRGLKSHCPPCHVPQARVVIVQLRSYGTSFSLYIGWHLQWKQGR